MCSRRLTTLIWRSPCSIAEAVERSGWQNCSDSVLGAPAGQHLGVASPSLINPGYANRKLVIAAGDSSTDQSNKLLFVEFHQCNVAAPFANQEEPIVHSFTSTHVQFLGAEFASID